MSSRAPKQHLIPITRTTTSTEVVHVPSFLSKKMQRDVFHLIENVQQIKHEFLLAIHASQPEEHPKLFDNMINTLSSIQPKRRQSSQSGYMMYCKEQRPIVMQAHPGMKQKDLLKLMGTAWKALSPEQKETFHAKAKESHNKDQEVKGEPGELKEGYDGKSHLHHLNEYV
jgi:hypothetical protein